jgi:PIN domain nuclease of toxin-antitoxin system
VKLILDTHTLFWWLTDSELLPAHHRSLISTKTNEIFVSAVTGWEIAVKVKLGKWPEASPLLPDLTSKIMYEGFDILELSLAHAERAGLLDLVHRDPFDRMLAAQSIELDWPILTIDTALSSLGCRTL